MFSKKKDVFFESFSLIAENLNEAAQSFNEELQKLNIESNCPKQMKIYEDTGDKYTHVVYKALNRTFVTPLEREDIMGLTVKIDDVLDGMEATTSHLDLYGVNEPDEFIRKFAQIVKKSCDEIVNSINLLVNKKLLQIRTHTVRINELENEGDNLLYDSLKNLFSTTTDPLTIIKKKDIYEMMESILDACEDVADVLETIVMRNS